MRYATIIQWVDTLQIEYVVTKIGDVEDDDDEIFYYFESEKEMRSFQTKDFNEFIILNYSEETFHKIYNDL